MSLIRIIIGSLIGSAISAGAAIGLIYGGIQVSWWLGLILAIVGMIIGGFIAGFISRDRFPGMIAGFITGLFVFAGIVLFFWLILRVKLLDWYAANSSNIGPTINDFLNYFGIDPLSNLGTYLTNVITDKYTEYSSNMDTLVQEYVPKFSLIIGAIFGGIAIIVDTIAGRIGGRLNKIDEILGEDD